MQFYTRGQCEQWLLDRQRVKPDEVPGHHVERIEYPPKSHKMFFLALWIASNLSCRMPVLLWMTEWEIWGSSENWHLYYKLRSSYGNRQLLHEAPGHLFLNYEAEDLASFLEVAMLNGWGGYILTEANYVNTFFSHDEFLDFYAENDENLGDVRDVLRPKQTPNSQSSG